MVTIKNLVQNGEVPLRSIFNLSTPIGSPMCLELFLETWRNQEKKNIDKTLGFDMMHP